MSKITGVDLSKSTPLHSSHSYALLFKIPRVRSLALLASGAGAWTFLNGFQVANAAISPSLLVAGLDIGELSSDINEPLAVDSIRTISYGIQPDELPVPSSITSTSSPKKIRQQSFLPNKNDSIVNGNEFSANIEAYSIFNEPSVAQQSRSPELFKPTDRLSKKHNTIREAEAELKPVQAGQTLSELLDSGWVFAQATPVTTTNQKPDFSRYLLRVPPTTVVTITNRGNKDSDTPGSSITSPSGFGADYGSLFAGIGFQSRTRFSQTTDGSFSTGIGLGDARKSVGVEVALASLSTFKRVPFAVGSVSFKVHRLVSDDTSVGVGIENVLNWGGTDGGTSLYGAVSRYFPLKKSIDEPFSSITATVGIGNGRFRSEADVSNGTGSFNPFASVGVRVARPVSVIADWSGQTLGLGLSIAPFRDLPLTINPAVVDITGGAGDGARFTLGAGYGLKF